MQGRKSISVIGVMLLGAALASAQRGGPPARGGRGAGAGPQIQFGRQAPPDAPKPQEPGNQPAPVDHRWIPPQGPGPHMGDWLRKHEDLPFDQQQKALENEPDFQRLPPGIQQQLRNRLLRFNSLPPKQRDRMLNVLEKFEHMTPEQRQQAREMVRQFRSLPQDRQRALREGFHFMQDMTPEDRQKMVDSDAFKKKYSDQEREMMRHMISLGVGPATPQEEQSPQ